MSKFRKIVVVPIALILAGCCVVVSLVLHNSLTKVDANVAFNGISGIIDSHSENSTFNIVEVVPDASQASIGYLIDGQEPVDWKKGLSTISGTDGASGKDLRTKYMSDLKKELDLITTTNDDQTKPLYYADYKESYTKDGDDWTEIKLANTETLNAGTKGYTMKEVPGGAFNLDTDYVLAVGNDGLPSGDYNQNVDHFIYIAESDSDSDNSSDGDNASSYIQNRGYYGVIFKAADIPAGVSAKDYFATDAASGNHKAYKVKNAYAIVSQDSMDAIAKYDPHAAIYSVDNSNIESPYIYVGTAENYLKKQDDQSANDGTYALDYEKYTYYSLEMEYVPADEITDDTTYYEVDSERDDNGLIFYADKSGEYGAELDADEPYVKAGGDNADAGTQVMGYFKIKEGSQAYNFVGTGNGFYDIAEDANASLEYPANIAAIYIKGGFKNYDWFRNGVFNQDSTGNSDKMNFNVKVVTPTAMNNINWSDVDLLYINGGDGTASYSYDDDITGQTVFAIAKRAHETGFMMPVVVDYGLVENNVDSVWNFGTTTSMQRLAALLCCTNYDDLNIDSIDPDNYNNSWAVTWNSVKFDKRISSSSYQNGYVNGNIYVIPKNSAGSEAFLLRDFAASLTQKTDDETAFKNDADALGFGEIAEYINAENKIRKTENDANTGTTYDYFDKKISKDIILSYIISYANKRELSNPTESLNILDIEPGLVKTNAQNNEEVPTNSQALTKDKVKAWLGDSRYPGDENVTITYMTSSEFIGKIEDLNNYDMIYMGLICDANNKDDNGKTVYNDTNMNGLIYTNVGDVVSLEIIDKSGWYPPRIHCSSGLLENDYYHDANGNRTVLDDRITNIATSGIDSFINSPNTYRFSGNDITRQKKTALENYVKAGFPIVLGDGIITMGANNSKTVNEEYVDNCSVVYELFNDIKDKENVFVTGDNNKSLVNNKIYDTLTNAKPKIHLKEMEKVSGYDYVELKDNKISLEFTISNDGGVDDNALFNISLMLDSNADGKFSATQESIEANDIRLYNNGTIVTPQMDENGKYHYSVNSGNMTYKLEYDLPEGYIGIIPWKLDVSQATNEYRYDSTSGYFFRKNTSGEKEKIKILQINTDHVKYTNPDKAGSTTTFNMQTNQQFQTLIKGLSDFELDITTIDGTVYEADYKDGYLDKYDMVVMGFADDYSLVNTNGCIEGIKEYINSGKPVLFTHDCASYGNDSTGKDESSSAWDRKNFWGYDFNKFIRNDVGLDRYAIESNKALQSGETLTADNDKEVLINGEYRKVSDLYKEAIAYADANNTDIAYEPGSNKSKIVRQNQGYTNVNLSLFQKSGDGRFGKYKAFANMTGDAQYHTYAAEQVNSGQITTYPFKLDKNLNIAQTHRQYYQLDLNRDMDEDGESDIVVWYTLKDSVSGSNGYDLSPRDVRNNYYIYTMGNVTYSGVGHSTITGEEEMKLYINTLIAAYNSGVHAPTVSVTDSAADDAKDLSTIYVTIDEAIEAENNGENAIVDGEGATQNIYFSIKDTNIVRLMKSKLEYADFCLPIDEAEYNKGVKGEGGRVKDDYIMVTKNNDKIYLQKLHNVAVSAADPNSSYNAVQTEALASGIKYKASIPLSILPDGQNSVTLYVVGHSSITKSTNNGGTGATIDTSYDFKTVQIQRIGLADLD